jgi:hypothetical protein
VDTIACARAGFDLVHEFDAHAAAREPGLAMLGGGHRRGILIGNTRALWAPFVAAMRDNDHAHPLEHYTESTIDAALPADARVWYGHRRYDGAFVPLQRLAVVTGLGALAPSHLVIHPIYGPWFALRAVVIAAGEPVVHAPIDPPCRCEARCESALASALQGGDWRAWVAVRDACSLRAWRYTDEQIRYHYTKVWQVR